MGRRRQRGRHRATPRLRARLRRVGTAVVVTASAVLAVSAFGTGPPTDVDVDRGFVEAVRAEGRAVDPGETEVLLVQAARKLCEGRGDHGSAAARHASSLTAPEVDAVRRAYADDTRGFIARATDTYCPL
jgi:hypothetical protein